MFLHSDSGGGEAEGIRARPIHDNLALNVNHSLLAAPVLKNAPDLAWMTSYMGGDVVNRAQGVAGLHIANQIGHAVANFHRDNPEWAGEFSRHFADITRDPQMERAGGTNVAGDLMGWAKDAKHDVLSVNNDIRSVAHHTSRALLGLSNGLLQYVGVENQQGGVANPMNIVNSPANVMLTNAANAVNESLKQTVFNPSWYPQEYHSLDAKTSTALEGGLPGQTSVSGSRMSVATVKPDYAQSMNAGKLMLQWVNSQFDTIQHYYRAVEIAYRKYGYEGVVNILAPGIIGAVIGSMAGPEGSVGLGEATAATGEEVATDGLLAGLPTDAQAQVEAGLTKTAEQKAFEEAAAKAASPATKAKAVVSAASRPLRWGGRGASHVLDAMNAPASLGFQLAPTVMNAMPGIDPQYKAIWNASKNASGNLTTIGRGLSEAVGLGKNSALSGAVDGIVSLGEAPFMAGRAAAVEADATQGGRTLFATNADAVQNAFVTSSRYNSALKQIVKIVANNPLDRPKAVGEIAALFPRFSKGVFTDPQSVNDILDAATSPAELNARLGSIADTLDTAQAIKLPTQGLYGKLKALKISDGKIPSYFNHVLAQAPMDFDANGKAILTGTIKIGDPGSANMLGQLLRSNGWKSSDVSRIVGHLMTEADPKMWETTFKNALYTRGEQILDKQFLKGSSIPESILSKLRNGETLTDADHAVLDRTFVSTDNAKTYAKLQQAWHENVNKMVGSSQSTETGIYGSDGETALGKLADDKGASAIWFSQRGYLTLPRYQDWDRALSDFLKGAKKDLGAGARFKNAGARATLMTNDTINRWVNERFFKPLALLTPGWAFRVSLSEAALNTARIGPRNMLAGRVADRLIDNTRAAEARVQTILDRSGVDAGATATGDAAAIRDIPGGGMVKETKTAVPKASYYHGSSRGLPTSGPQEYGGHMGNIFPGSVFTTDSADIAREYTQKGAKGAIRRGEFAPTVHGMEWTGDSAPKLLDLEKPLSSADRTSLAGLLRGWDEVALGGEFQAASIIEKIDSGATGTEVFRAIRTEIADAASAAWISRDEALDDWQALEMHLQEMGYDGLRYDGGKIRGGTAHNAIAWVNPQHLSETSRTLIGENLPKAAEPVTPEAIHSLIGERGYTINKTLGDRIALVTRGVMSQTDKAILEGIGKADFAKYAGYLIYRHDGWLPSAADSREMQMFQDFDKAAGSDKLASGIGTQKEQLNPHDFKLISPEQAGGINGWQRQATAIAADPLLGQPLAEAYLRLVESGKTGDELHSLAVGEAERILKSLPENELRTMSRATQVASNHAPFGLDPLASWAETAVRGLEGTVKANAFINKPLLESIAKDELPGNLKDFHEAYVKGLDNSQIPNMVSAPEVKYSKSFAGIERASAWGHQKVLGPIVNNLSRKPLFIAEFVNARRALEDSVEKGMMTVDQADIIAETRAAERMTRYIHNPADKTHFEEMMRTVAPFYFAENQAWRRMGRLFAENPGAFGQYLRAMLGVQQWVSTTSQNNGISLVNVPGLAFFGMPLTASLSSLQTMDPLAVQQEAGQPESLSATVMKSLTPNFGPVVSFPTAVLAQTPLKNNATFQKLQPKLQGEIGAQETFGQNVWSTILPNSVLRDTAALLAGFTASNDAPPGALDNSYMQARLESVRELLLERGKTQWDNLTKLHISPEERDLRFSVWQSTFLKQLSNGGDDSTQALLNEANRRAGVLWLAKMAAGLVSPVSTGIGEAGSQLHQLMNSYVANPKYHGDYGAAVDAFLKKYPYAQAATLYKTSTQYGYIPETKPISDYISSNPEAVQKYPYAMLAYGPSATKDTKFYEPAASQLVADGLRQKETPNEFLNSFFVSTGNQFFYNYIQKGYEARKAAGDPQAYTWYTNMQTAYGQNYNPAWWKAWNTDASASTKNYAVQQLSEMVNDPAYNTPKYKAQTEAYRFILNDVYPLLKQRKDAIASNYGQLPNGSTTTTAETKLWWNGVIALLLKELPQAAPGIEAIFANQG